MQKLASTLRLELLRDAQCQVQAELDSPCSRWPTVWLRNTFTEESHGQLEVYAGNAAGAVAVAISWPIQAQLRRICAQALTSRAVIDRAIRIMMAQQRRNASAAFDLLRRASQNRNVKLRELAADIVTAVSGKPPQPSRVAPD
ncbi:MAG: ANTAR domain-containing protein [Actinomycetota bacterium]|nr:ANTAR domain-containing protein [Actinomycetota bacterium]